MDPTIIVKETLGVILLLGRPVCRLLYECSVSERLDVTEKTLDKAYNEIHQKDVLPGLDPKVIDAILEHSMGLCILCIIVWPLILILNLSGYGQMLLMFGISIVFLNP